MHGYQNETLIGTAPKMHGRKRGLVFDPLEVFELLRDTWHNAPIPPDAQFEAVSIEKSGADSFICFYYSTSESKKLIIVGPQGSDFNPMSHCISLKPQMLVDILKYWFHGDVPNDAEPTAFYINQFFNSLCIEVASDKFPNSDASKMPMIHLTYDQEKVISLNDRGETKQTMVNPLL